MNNSTERLITSIGLFTLGFGITFLCIGLYIITDLQLKNYKISVPISCGFLIMAVCFLIITYLIYQVTDPEKQNPE